MDVNSLPKTVTRQRRDCDLNPSPSAPESSTLTTRLPSHPRVTVGMGMATFSRVPKFPSVDSMRMQREQLTISQQQYVAFRCMLKTILH